MSNPSLIYVVKEGDRYVETIQGFEFKYNGSPTEGFYQIFFNGKALDPVSNGRGKCQPIGEGRYKLWGPKGEELGEFGSFPHICRALEPYTYELHYGKS